MEITIKGSLWKIEMLGIKEYIQKHGQDSWAVADKEAKTITFCDGDFTIGKCRHEVFHAFISECCVWSIPPCEGSVMEEIAAGLLEVHWDDIEKIAQYIFTELPLEKLGVSINSQGL